MYLGRRYAAASHQYRLAPGESGLHSSYLETYIPFPLGPTPASLGWPPPYSAGDLGAVTSCAVTQMMAISEAGLAAAGAGSEWWNLENGTS